VLDSGKSGCDKFLHELVDHGAIKRVRQNEIVEINVRLCRERVHEELDDLVARLGLFDNVLIEYLLNHLRHGHGRMGINGLDRRRLG
jgi:hypothetical protein